MEILHRYHIRMRMRDLKQGRQSVLCAFSVSCVHNTEAYGKNPSMAPLVLT